MPEQPRPNVRVLPWALVALTVVVVGLVTVGPFAGSKGLDASPTSTSNSGAPRTAPSTTPTTASTTVPPTTAPSALAGAVRRAGVRLDPRWPRSLTVLTDSVVLGAKDALPQALPGWTVDVRGRPALMLKVAEKELAASARPVGSVAVVALGYNSLWGRDRANFDAWARKFDHEADQLVATLRRLGAKKVVWVTLRVPDASFVPADKLAEGAKYSWYFGYVNERLDALAARDRSVAIADWNAVSHRPGLTYDAIHLRPLGARLMSEVIKAGAGLPPAAVPGL